MKAIPLGGSGSGTVASVALVMPGQFAVSGSPVIDSGSLIASWNVQAANTVLAGPTSGASAAPTFRTLGLGDISGLGTAASHAATDFQAAGSYLVSGNNLSDLASAASARTNLGLGSSALHPDSYFLTPSGDGSNLTGITESQVSGLVSDLAAKAPLASPALTGVPTAPTALAGTNTTQVATTAFVLANLPAIPVTSVAGRTGAVTLSTTDISGLGSIATHAATDFLTPTGNGSGLTGITESQVANLTTDLAAKAPLASPTFTGTTTVAAVAIGDGNNIALGSTVGTKIGTATTQKLGFFNAAPIAQPTGNLITAVQNFGLVASATIAESDITGLVSDLAAKAPTASPTLTGTVTMPVPSLPSQAQNAVFAAPSSGTGAPSFRALVAGDIPAIAESGVTGLVSDLALKAPLASPALTGVPTVPTATVGTNTTQAASTAFVLANLPAVPVTSVAGKTGAVTLVESDIASLTTDLAAKAPLASPTFTGTVTVPAVSIGDGSDVALGTTTGTKLGTGTTQKLGFYNATPVVQPTGNVLTALTNLGLVASPTLTEANVTNLTTDLAALAPLASPTFTGTVTLPTVSATGATTLQPSASATTPLKCIADPGTSTTRGVHIKAAPSASPSSTVFHLMLEDESSHVAPFSYDGTNIYVDIASGIQLQNAVSGSNYASGFTYDGTFSVLNPNGRMTFALNNPTVTGAYPALALVAGGVNYPSTPQIIFQGNSSTTAARTCGLIGAQWATNTDATRTGRLVFYASDYNFTLREAFRIEADGSAARIGFFGGSAITKPSGNALTALSSLGLITSPTLTESNITNLTTDLAAKAPLAGPTFTGTTTLAAVAIGDGSNVALGTTTGTQIGTGTTQKLAFYGSTPVVKPTVTGSRGGNAALASLLTALANLGLIVDSSSA